MSWGEWANIATPIVVAIFGGLIRQSIGRITDRLERLERRADQSDERNKEIRSELERRVQREDFIRESSRTRNTLERLLDGQARLEGRLDVGVRIAAAVERVVDTAVTRNTSDGEDRT